MIAMTRKNKFKRDPNDHSVPILMSYNMGEFLGQILGRTIGGIYLFFYETELLLAGGFILAANIIFSIWNAVNDPIIGYLCNKPTRWTKKWGKFFPWIMISGIPMIFAYMVVLQAPESLPDWGLFTWLLITLCLADLFASMFSVNTFGLYPTKFRSKSDRRRSGQVHVVIGTLGTVLAFMIPPYLYEFGDIPSYRSMAVYIGIFALIIWILLVPGVKPDRISLQLEQRQPKEEESFFRVLRTAFRQKNYLIYIVGSFSYFLWVSMSTTSLPYFVKNILQLEAGAQTMIWVFYLGGTLISLPLWNMVAKKYGFVKLFGYCLILMGVFNLPLIFVRNIYGIYGIFFAMGFSLGGFWSSFLPIFGLVMDEVFYDTRKQQTGVYLGIRTFISRFEIIIRTILFIVIHKLTEYDPEAVQQTKQAEFGIILHAAYIPALVAIVGAVIFLLTFKMNEEKKLEIQEFIQHAHEDFEE